MTSCHLGLKGYIRKCAASCVPRASHDRPCGITLSEGSSVRAYRRVIRLGMARASSPGRKVRSLTQLILPQSVSRFTVRQHAQFHTPSGLSAIERLSGLVQNKSMPGSVLGEHQQTCSMIGKDPRVLPTAREGRFRQIFHINSSGGWVRGWTTTQVGLVTAASFRT